MSIALRQFKAEHVAVERERPFQVGHFQMDVANPNLRMKWASGRIRFHILSSWHLVSNCESLANVPGGLQFIDRSDDKILHRNFALSIRKSQKRILAEGIASAYCRLPPTATGSLQPYRIAIKRSPKQRNAPIVIAAAAETCSICPITTTAAPARAATA